MSNGSIQLDISNATVEAPAKSELLDIGGNKWQIISPAECSPNHISIVCNPNCTDRLWLCKVKYCFEKKEGTSDWKKLEEWRPLYRFNSYKNSVLQTFKGNGMGTQNFIKVNIEVEWSASQSNLHPVDASLNLIFAGKSDELVPVNKLVLAVHSNYFHNFFLGKLAAVSTRNDVNGNPIYDINEDPDFAYGQFRFLIYAFLCMGSMVEQLDVNWFPIDKVKKIALMKLAVKYNLLEDFAEKQLIKLGPGTMDLLELADQFTLAGLKKHCLETITNVEYCKDHGKNVLIREKLSPATKKELDAKLEECANKNWKLV